MTYRGSDIEILLTERQPESRKTKTAEYRHLTVVGKLATLLSPIPLR